MSLTEAIDSTTEYVKWAWTNDRTFLVSILVAIVIFCFAIVWFLTSTFLWAMDKKDDKMAEALKWVTDALNKNTEAVTELRVKLSFTN